MKEVMAVIRMNKMNMTKKALAEAGITSMYARSVWGGARGRSRFPGTLRGRRNGTKT